MTSPSVTPAARWTGLVLGVLASLMMLFSVVMKWWAPDEIPAHFAELGWSMAMIRAVGLVELLCTVAYLTPRFSVLGALLLTGYLGGAVAAHVRIADGQMPFPLGLGALLWLGLWLREPRLRALLPLRVTGYSCTQPCARNRSK